MKFNYKNICLAALAACSVTACDLDTAPTTSLEANAVFKNLENADRVIRGSWNYIFNSGSTYASIGYGAIMINDDFAGSDVVRTTSYGYSSSYAAQITKDVFQYYYNESERDEIRSGVAQELDNTSANAD